MLSDSRLACFPPKHSTCEAKAPSPTHMDLAASQRWVSPCMFLYSTGSLNRKSLKTRRAHIIVSMSQKSKGPRTQQIGFQGFKYCNISGIGALKPYYLGPWTLRGNLTCRSSIVSFGTKSACMSSVVRRSTASRLS